MLNYNIFCVVMQSGLRHGAAGGIVLNVVTLTVIIMSTDISFWRCVC
jgi:hypothetical protein